MNNNESDLINSLVLKLETKEIKIRNLIAENEQLKERIRCVSILIGSIPAIAKMMNDNEQK